MSTVDKRLGGVGGDPDRPVHENVRKWQVPTVTTPDKENGATIGIATVHDTSRTGHPRLAEVFVYASLDDGALVVDVATHAEQETPLRVRVCVNDGDVYDATIGEDA